MEIKGKVHCFFEQSGTFKNEFIKLGIPAEDYDIQNNFGETEHVTDLFAEIRGGYEGKPSIFDSITKDDLIVAFFPCIHFCDMSTMNLKAETLLHQRVPLRRTYEILITRHKERDRFFGLLQMMICNVLTRGLRLVFENPWNGATYLRSVLRAPNIVDRNRMVRGDFFVKPTAYWFYNCEPTYGKSEQNDKQQHHVWDKNKQRIESCKQRGIVDFGKSSKEAGLCSEERSMISPDYARNFICDFIIGKTQKHTIPDLFNNN